MCRKACLADSMINKEVVVWSEHRLVSEPGGPLSHQPARVNPPITVWTQIASRMGTPTAPTLARQKCHQIVDLCFPLLSAILRLLHRPCGGFTSNSVHRPCQVARVAVTARLK